MLFINLLIKRSSENSPVFTLSVEFQTGSGITALFGPSGAGKSTILQAIAGLLHPEKGCIVVSAETFFDSEKKIDLSLQKRRVGYVFQDLALFSHLSVEANVIYGLNRLNRHERRSKALEILERFGLESFIRRKPHELSGGQQQRVALARAVVIEPRILLLDEPLSALDAATKRDLIEDLKKITRDLQIPILYVTHNRDEVLALSSKVIVLDHGKIVAQGEPLSVLENLGAPTLARLSGAENLFEGVIIEKRPERGTMTFQTHQCQLEIPFAGYNVENKVRLAIRAGDILLSLAEPVGLSARNRLHGRVTQLTPQGYDLLVQTECNGMLFTALITREAQQELKLKLGQEVWLVFKTHACYIVESEP